MHTKRIPTGWEYGPVERVIVLDFIMRVWIEDDTDNYFQLDNGNRKYSPDVGDEGHYVVTHRYTVMADMMMQSGVELFRASNDKAAADAMLADIELSLETVEWIRT